KDEDVYWCTADIGWVTGHSYVVYGPLCNGATTFMYEGAPNHPGPDRFWSIVARHNVRVFYTAAPALPAFRRRGRQSPQTPDLPRGQTETGAIMIPPLPGAVPTKPGSGTLPFFGVVPEVVDKDGQPVGADVGGYLVIRKPWPSMLRTIYGDPERYVEQYWKR